MNFVKFREYNDHEGESWNFWLQLDGNEEEIAKLEKILRQNDDEGWYKIDLENPIEEFEVDILVKHSDGGYMADNTKVVGKLTCPEFSAQDSDEAWEWISDNFYKGDIQRHFEV